MYGEVFGTMADRRPPSQDIVQFTYQEQAVRALIDKDGQSWFCVTDLCGVLGYNNSMSAVEKLCEDAEGRAKFDTPTSSGVQSLAYISEANLYMLICGSKLAAVKSFRVWITREVLPALRSREVCTPEVQTRAFSHVSTKALEEACRTVAKLPEVNRILAYDIQRLHLKLVEKDFRISALEAERGRRETTVRIRLAALHHAAMLHARGRGYADIAHLLGTDLDLAQRMVVTWETLSELNLVPALQQATLP
ncbi:Bro-N domain-containing protein [Cupriavidus basilensis]|uniref:Bro-N domain-containing protein n=1 Tax=Cupriavidus basilensis TaxID=68895 RepID=A0ABT6AW12_9BURK|nr:Bro-N domain-containing protein [Cupriavidus basilensis]MDF3836807.1 Bro-N domain-containing protein [Cupriavidus basilensis]